MADDAPVDASAAPTEAVETFSLASADPECIAWIKSKVHLAADELAWQPEHEEIIAEFVASPATRRMFVFFDAGLGGLTLQLGTPQPSGDAEREIQYFLKPEKTVLTLTGESYMEDVTFEGLPDDAEDELRFDDQYFAGTAPAFPAPGAPVPAAPLTPLGTLPVVQALLPVVQEIGRASCRERV